MSDCLTFVLTLHVKTTHTLLAIANSIYDPSRIHGSLHTKDDGILTNTKNLACTTIPMNVLPFI